MALENRERIDYLDTAKGIGIILVCAGHACTNHTSITDCQFADIIRFVTLFHMALFFFINGMLYHEKYSIRPVRGCLKKFKIYYIPFVTYNLLFWLLHNVFNRLHMISGQLDSKDYAYTNISSFLISFVKSVVGFKQRFAGAMWFLEALILISAVFIFLDFVATKWFYEKRMVVLSVGVVLIVLCNRLLNLTDMPYIPKFVSQLVYWGNNGLVCFWLGYLFRCFHWNDKLLKYKNILSVLLFAALVLTVILMRPQIISVITNASIPIYQYGIGAIIGNRDVVGLSLLKYLFFSIICFAGIIMTLLVSQTKYVSQSRILRLLGRYSLHIMCLQFLAFKAVSAVIILIYQLPIDRLAEYPVIYDINGLWWMAYTIAGCVLPVITIKLWERFKINFMRVTACR